MNNCLIEDFEFSVRIYKCLKRAGVNTKNELEQLTRDDLLKIRNLSTKNVNKIAERKDINLKTDIMKNTFKFKVADALQHLIFTAYRKDDSEEVYLVTWTEFAEESSEIYHEKTVEQYLKEHIWIIQ